MPAIIASYDLSDTVRMLLLVDVAALNGANSSYFGWLGRNHPREMMIFTPMKIGFLDNDLRRGDLFNSSERIGGNYLNVVKVYFIRLF
ncbi:hypothetical protein [Serratia sp. D1N4]